MTESEALTHVANLIELLGDGVRTRRARYGLSLRQAAREAGVSFTTISRAELDQPLSGPTIILLFRWLAKRAA